MFLRFENIKINVFIQNYSFWIDLTLTLNFTDNMNICRKLIVRDLVDQMIFAILFVRKVVRKLFL